MLVRLTAETLHNLDRALSLEWLETNGLGSFACGTVIGANTRRYHGLFTLAQNPPGGRVLLLSSLEEQLLVGAESVDLSCHVYLDVVHPQGWQNLAWYETGPWSTWGYEGKGWRLRREVVLPHGIQAAVIRYTLDEARHPVTLVVRPLIAGRDYHALRRAGAEAVTSLGSSPGGMAVTMDGWATCVLQAPGAETFADGLWYYRFRYPVEQERGLDFVEDLFSPGIFRWLLMPGASVYLVAAGQEQDFDPTAVLEHERERRGAVAGAAAPGDDVGRRLLLAADQFVCRRPVGDKMAPTIVAGYPWFVDWGRDALISMPGLLLATGRLTEARELLEMYLGHLHRGLVPNCFTDDGCTACYNSIDAALWLFVGAREYLAASRDRDFAAVAYPALAEALRWLEEGTDFAVAADTDGLLRAGTPATQLTWMDAQVDGVPVTPRWHKPVEIEALWFNALRVMEYLARSAGETQNARKYSAMARRAGAAFRPLFWDAGRGYLADCVTPDGPDWSLRPNQVLALALPYKLVPDNIAHAALRVVEEKLLTPFGLRTLSPDHPDFCPIYQGGPAERDRAYHQGTVWPWLLGPYIRAKLRLAGADENRRKWAKQLLQPLVAHLDEACLGQISEIFDATWPYAPRGCFAQAWSVAAVLRVWMTYRLWESG
ncbi:MAG: amylo-alpha-1,6-glucosidase [Armatimonadetes bacterium]|nr:amylo-alpha-1,6-glucosidase [Armatimonadota bacterium]